jgi:DNA-binding NarL/FixJ family response regulator
VNDCSVLVFSNMADRLRLLERFLLMHPSVELVGALTDRSLIVEQVECWAPNIILLDTWQPDLVKEVFEEIKRTNSRIVIIVDPSTSEVNIAKGLVLGASGYVRSRAVFDGVVDIDEVVRISSCQPYIMAPVISVLNGLAERDGLSLLDLEWKVLKSVAHGKALPCPPDRLPMVMDSIIQKFHR